MQFLINLFDQMTQTCDIQSDQNEEIFKHQQMDREMNNFLSPMFEGLFGFDQDRENEERLEYDKEPPQKLNNGQLDYVRRRLQNEGNETIKCSNNETSKYAQDYKFIFEPFAKCNVSHSSNRILQTTEPITTFNTSNVPLLYSANCEFLLIFSNKSTKIEIIASQQTMPIWSSMNSKNGTFLLFNSENGDLSILDNEKNTVWTASNTSNWIDENEQFKSPYFVQLNDDFGTLQIIDSNNAIRWFSDSMTNKMDFRESVYSVVLMDTKNQSIVYSALMNVILSIYEHQTFFISFEFDQSNDILDDVALKFNVSVFLLSSNDIGDEYVVFDDNLPMIYWLKNGQIVSLDITQSHTFLCLSKERRYFKIELLPNSFSINIDRNYSLMIDAISSSNDSFFTLAIDPWNPCNSGKPILAQKNDRRCFVNYDNLEEAMSAYNEYSANSAYANVDIKYVFKSTECAQNVIANSTDLVFSKNFSILSCEQVLNESFDSVYCKELRSKCGDYGYFDVCLDFVQNLCVCLCPRDKKGIFCKEYRDYDCSLNILNANMTECALMSQSDLNKHGRDDYDVTMDGDKPCFFVIDEIESVVALECEFKDKESSQKVWENLKGYDIKNENVSFDYCVGNDSSKFALSNAPKDSHLRIKIFHFARIFNDDEAYIIPLDIEHFSGDKNIIHKTVMNALKDSYKIGGRVYIEYQLWQDGDRVAVERRFYDIDHWKMPPSKRNYDSSQRWFIAISVLLVIAFIAYCLFRCNKWCKTLEHEKID